MNTQATVVEILVDGTGETPCECQKYSIERWKGEVPQDADPGLYVDYIEIGCIQTTRRTFAPGHDAKLKSLMIQAGAEGSSIRRDDGGMAHIGEPVDMASFFGFEHQVAAGIAKARAKGAAKLERKAKREAVREARLAAKAEKAAQPRKTPLTKIEKAEARDAKEARAAKATPLVAPTTIKVGRWTYEATINPTDNSAEYTSGSGETKTAEEGKYAIVQA